MKISKEKIAKIKATLSETRKRRELQECKVYKLKIDESHLNQDQTKFLKGVFLEAKWFYNFLLSQENIFDSKDLTKSKSVRVKKLEIYEDRKINYLSSQMRKGMFDRVIDATKVLSKLKEKGFQVGKLKYTKEIDSIELPQYNITWSIVNNSSIKIQKQKKPFKVQGLKQIPENSEFANAFLIKSATGYYIHITTFQFKKPKTPTGKDVGIDLGINTTVTTSDGQKFNIEIPESDKLKRLQMWASKKKNGSKNKIKLINKIKKEYEKITNQKKDVANKIVNFLKTNYDKIFMQDENISGWQKSGMGRSVQHSALGTIKAKLKNLESTQVLSKWEPTTKLCPNCGTLNDVPRSSDVYSCDCGYSCDRDIHGARNMLFIGRRNFDTSTGSSCTLAEELTSVDSGSLDFGIDKLVSMKQAAFA